MIFKDLGSVCTRPRNPELASQCFACAEEANLRLRGCSNIAHTGSGIQGAGKSKPSSPVARHTTPSDAKDQVLPTLPEKTQIKPLHWLVRRRPARPCLCAPFLDGPRARQTSGSCRVVSSDGAASYHMPPQVQTVLWSQHQNSRLFLETPSFTF